MSRSAEIRDRLSLLWIAVMFEMAFNDIFTIILEMSRGSRLELPLDAPLMMAIAAVLTSIPIAMIFLTKVLPFRAARVVTIAAGSFTILYVIGGGSLSPHYIIVAAMEVAALAAIIASALRWKGHAE
jgi:hypothetical protein